MLDGYRKRAVEPASYISTITNRKLLDPYFNFVFDCFEINPTYLIDLQTLLPAWRNHLENKSSIIAERFEERFLQSSDRNVQYKEHHASKIIFCNGVKTFDTAFWAQLPYVHNKGRSVDRRYSRFAWR